MKKGLLAVLALTLAAAAPCRAAGSAEDALAKARALFQADRDTEAVVYLKEAAEGGSAKAQFHLGLVYEHGRAGQARDEKVAAEWLAKSAAQGFAPAQNSLADLYYEGSGVARDYGKALELYTQAARQPDFDGWSQAIAWSNLGNLYFWGRGVARDYAKAFELYSKAADKGNAYAQNNLGYLYEHGLGVKKDPKKALEWYRKAAEQGRAEAQRNVAVMYEADRHNEVEALKWLQKGAADGHPWPQYRLARAYERGQGVPKDLVQAYKWYLLSAKQGNRHAEAAVQRLKNTLSADDQEKAKALADQEGKAK